MSLNTSHFIQALPQVLSVSGGIALVAGLELPGFLLLTTLSVGNLIGSLFQRKHADSWFHTVWVLLNTWFAMHVGGH